MSRLGALVVVFLLVGCLSGGGAGPTEPASGAPEAPWAAGEGLNVTALAHHHFAALRAAGSFTLERTASVAIDGEVRPDDPHPEWYRPPSETRIEVDLEDRRAGHRSVTAGSRQAERFASPEEEATRRRPCPREACAWEYRYLARADPETLIGPVDRYRTDRPVEMLSSVLTDWTYTFVETTTREGTTLHRYRADRSFERPVHPFADRPTASGTVVVTDAGVIRNWTYRYTGPATYTVDGEARTVTVTQRYTLTVTDVGATAVERPDWVDRARARDPAPTTATAPS